VVFLLDGHHVLSGGTDSLLQLWELPPWQEGGATSDEKRRR
jgi:hypothetical protein